MEYSDTVKLKENILALNKQNSSIHFLAKNSKERVYCDIRTVILNHIIINLDKLYDYNIGMDMTVFININSANLILRDLKIKDITKLQNNTYDIALELSNQNNLERERIEFRLQYKTIVNYKVIGSNISESTETIYISAKGISFISYHLVNKKDIVVVNVNLNNNTYEIIGVCVRCETLQKDKYKTCLEFMFNSLQDQDVLRQTLNIIQVKEFKNKRK